MPLSFIVRIKRVAENIIALYIFDDLKKETTNGCNGQHTIAIVLQHDAGTTAVNSMQVRNLLFADAMLAMLCALQKYNREWFVSPVVFSGYLYF